MRILAQFDLTGADIAAFEAYESAVLPLLADHGAVLEQRLRSLDGTLEAHLIRFPDAAARQAYLDDPRRAAQAHLWTSSGVRSTSTEMREV